MEKPCQVCHKPCKAVCVRCKGVHYCCREHQKKHWKAHKKVCAIHVKYLEWFRKHETTLREQYLETACEMRNVPVLNENSIIVTTENYDGLSENWKTYFWNAILCPYEDAGASLTSAMISLGAMTPENCLECQVPDVLMEYCSLPAHPWFPSGL